MYALAVRNCVGTAGTLFKALLLAASFYVVSADQFSALRPGVVDVALVRYRAAVDTTLRSRLDVGDLDRKIVRVAADLDPRLYFGAARAELKHDVNIVFDKVLDVPR